MDAMRSSHKRKQPSSSQPHPLFGTLTRIKSQFFLHRHPDLRSDPVPRNETYTELHRSPSPRKIDKRQQSSDCDEDDMLPIEDPCKKMKPNQEASTGDDDELSRILIKDLRSRRVYSPQSVGGPWAKENGLDSDCGDQKIADLGFAPSMSVGNNGCEKGALRMNGEIDKLGKGFSSEGQNKDETKSVLCLLNEYRPDYDAMDSGNEETESTNLGFPCEAQNFDHRNPESSGETEKLQDRKHCDGSSGQNNGGNSSEKIDDSKEELVRTTSPDAVICVDSKVNEDEAKRIEGVHVKDTHCSGSAEENAGESVCPRDNQSNDFVRKSKSVLRPRFQGKLFKAPGSVSYKRLFPFLMGDDDSVIPKLGQRQKHENGMDGQQFQLPLLSQSQEASDNCTMHDISESGASAVDAVVACDNELSYDDQSNSHYFLEVPMQLDTKEVASECLSVSSINDKCLSKSKADPVADFRCFKDAANALHSDDFKHDSEHNKGVCTSEHFGVLNKECAVTTPPDAEICGNLAVNVGQVESIPRDMYHGEAKGLTGNTQKNAGEGFCLATDKGKYSVFKSKCVPRPHLRRKLFKTPGSFSYRRLLPFLMDLTKDDSGTPKLGHHQKDEADMYAKRRQLPLPSQCQEASIDEHKISSGPMHATVESDALTNHMLIGPANEFSSGNQPKLISSQYLPESPLQLDPKEVVHECLSAPSINELIEKEEIRSKDTCLSDSKADLCSVMVDFHCDMNVANALHKSKSPPKAQNLLYVDPNVSNLTFEHHSTKEKGFVVDHDERKQYVSQEKHESARRCPLEGQSLNHMDPNMLDAEENETSNHASSRRDDAVVLKVDPGPSSDKIIIEKSDTAGHDYKAESVPKGMVYVPRMPSTRSNIKNASCCGEIRNNSQSKTTLVLNRCSQIKLLKHAGSLNYKRLQPFLLNTMKNNSCTSVNDDCPKLQKCLDQTPLLPISALDSRGTSISDSDDRVFPIEHCRGSSGTQQQAGFCDDSLNNGSSRPRSSAQIPQKSSHDSCKVIQLQGEQVVLNGHSKMETTPDQPISVQRIDLPTTRLGPIINGVITREEEASSPLPLSSVYSEVKGNSSFLISSNGKKPLETDGCCQNLSQLKALEQLGVPAVGFRKGILKRNPRGCRGLCTCLNCVSFRLHAERAFEFSRNQLLDAEEVALDLIKELSRLRNILERSIDSVNDHPVFDGNQVKEACRKALETEQISKDRLSQMNDGLNIHCRISSLQRPRVRFADQVEEKVIPRGG